MLDTTYWNVPWQDEDADPMEEPLPKFVYATPLDDEDERMDHYAGRWRGGHGVTQQSPPDENHIRPRRWYPGGLGGWGGYYPWHLQLGLNLEERLKGTRIGCLCDGCARFRQ